MKFDIKILFLLLTCLACSNEKYSEYQVVSASSSLIDGNSRILFKTTLPKIHSTEYYEINARLYAKDSELILYSHFNGFDQEDAVKIYFLREELTLRVSASTPKFSKQLLFEKPAYFKTANSIFLTVKVSNDLNGVYVQIWNNFINQAGAVRKRVRFLSMVNLLFDSSEEGTSFLSYGRGKKWGVKLNKTQINSIRRVLPYEI